MVDARESRAQNSQPGTLKIMGLFSGYTLSMGVRTPERDRHFCESTHMPKLGQIRGLYKPRETEFWGLGFIGYRV